MKRNPVHFPFLRAAAFFLILLCSSLTGRGEGYASLMRQISERSPNDRILSLELLLDTLSPANKTPEKIEIILNLFQKLADSSGDLSLNQRISFIRRIKFKYSETDPLKHIEFYTNAKAHYDKAGMPFYSAICLHYIGQNQFVLGDYGSAFENLLKAHDSFRKTGLEKIPEIGLYMHNLALDHYFFKEYEQSVALMEKAMELPPFGPNIDIQRFNTLACSYRSLGQYEKARQFFDSTLQKAVFYRDSTWMGITLGNTGALFFREGNFQQALEHFQQSLALLSRNEMYPVLSRQAILNVAETYIRLKNYPAAREYILSLSQVSEKNKRAYFGDQQEEESYLKKYHDVLKQYFFDTKDYKTAYLHMDSLSSLDRDHNLVYGQDQVKAVHNHLKIQEQQTRLRLGEKENQLLLFRLWISVFIAVLVLLSITLLFYRKKLRDKKEKILLLSRHRSLEIEQQKTREQLRQARIRLNEYVRKIQEKTAMASSPRNENPESASGPVAENFHSTIERLKTKRILTKDDWKEFQSLFHQAFPHFSEETYRKYCELTPSELRYLMLEKIGLSATEMANVLGVSPDSIRVTRHRLGKKKPGPRKYRKSNSYLNTDPVSRS